MVAEVPLTLEYRGDLRKPEVQWSVDERNAANLDQRLKGLIMFVLPDDQDSQDSPDDKEVTRSSQEYLTNLNKEYQDKALSAKSKRFFKKDTKLVAKTHEWDEEEVSSDEELVEVKAFMALAKEERTSITKDEARNGKWVQISMEKEHTLLKLENNDGRKYLLNHVCADLNYVENQRYNILSKHKDLSKTLTTCKENLNSFDKIKKDFLFILHVNTDILLKNKHLIEELNKIKSVSKTRLNNSIIVNQCVSELITSQDRGLGVEVPSSSGQQDSVLVKSSTEDFTVPFQITERTLPIESQNNSPALDYDSSVESPVYDNSLPPLERLEIAEPISRLRDIKSILKSKSNFKQEIFKDIFFKPSSVQTKDKHVSVSASADKQNFLKMNMILLWLVICGSYDHETNGHNRIISLEREANPGNPQHPFKRCEVCGSSIYTTTDHYDIE
ncbi:hypothetical protein Tco_1174469 [Tanacetum coccineum]